ncbi:MAG: LysR family substrate-binding domain-containing protein [Elainellaceae cyanobacterium]
MELGFSLLLPDADDVSYDVLASEPVSVALAETHPLAGYEELALSQLATEPWITGIRSGHCGLLMHILSVCRQAGFTPTVQQETNEIHMALGFVMTEVGVTLLPASTSHWKPIGVAYRPLNPPVSPVELMMIWRPQHVSPVLNTFLQTVRNSINVKTVSGDRKAGSFPDQSLQL